MAQRGIGSDPSVNININPHILGAKEAAGELKINPELVDRVLNKYGSDLVKELGPSYLQYLRVMGNSLTELTSRMHEAEIKAVPASMPEPKNFQEQWFTVRDTSNLVMFEDRLPVEMLESPKVIDTMAQKGWFSKEVATGVKELLFNVDKYLPSKESRKTEVTSSSQEEEWHFDSVNFVEEEGEVRMQHYALEAENPAQTPASTNPADRPVVPTGPAGGPSATPASNPSDRTPPANDPTNRRNPSPVPAGPPGPPVNRTQGQNPTQQNWQGMDMGLVPHNSPLWPMFQTCFQSDSWANQATGSILNRMASRKNIKNQILMEMNNIDPTTPDGARRMTILNQRLSEISGDDQQDMMTMQELQRAKNTLYELLSKTMEIFFDTQKKIVANMGK